MTKPFHQYLLDSRLLLRPQIERARMPCRPVAAKQFQRNLNHLFYHYIAAQHHNQHLEPAPLFFAIAPLSACILIASVMISPSKPMCSLNTSFITFELKVAGNSASIAVYRIYAVIDVDACLKCSKSRKSHFARVSMPASTMGKAL
jgi:hypothetical protein